MIRSKKTYLMISLMLAVMILFITIMGTQTMAVSLSKVVNFNNRFEGNKAKLEWSEVEGADGYEVYVDIPGRGETYVGSTSSPRASIIGFVRGAKYSAKVRAFKMVEGQKEFAEFSDNVELQIAETNDDEKKLGNIENFNLAIADKKARLTWDKVEGANGYEVHVDIPGIGYIYLGSVSGNYATITGFTDGFEYKAKIRAFRVVSGKKDYSEYSKELAIKIDESMSLPDDTLNKVTNVQVAVKDQVATVTWTPVTGADKYEILLTMPSGKKLTIEANDITKTIADITDKSGDYTVQVRSYRTVNGIRLYGEFSDEVKFKSDKKDETQNPGGTTEKPNNPNTNTSTNTTTNTTGNTSINENISSKPNTNTNTNINTSTDPKPQEIKKPAMISGLRLGTITTDSGTVIWDVVKSDDKHKIAYQIEIIGPNNYKKTYTSNTSSIKMTGLKPGKTYSVRVIAYKILEDNTKLYAERYTDYIYFVTEVEKPDQVTGLTVTNTTETSGTINWNQVAKKDEYQIIYEVRIVYPNGVTKTYETQTPPARFGDLEPGFTYLVQVRAKKWVGSIPYYGAWSSSVQILTKPTKPAKVTGLNVNVTGERTAIVTWNRVEQTDNYEIGYDIQLMNANGIVISAYATADTRFNLVELQPGTAYKIKVRAFKKFKGENIFGDFSTPDRAFSTPRTTPDKVTGLDVTGEYMRYTLSWDRATSTSGTNSYEIEVTDTTNNSKNTYKTSSTSYTVNNVRNLMTARVRAVNSIGGAGAWSDYVMLNQVKTKDGSMDGNKPKMEWEAVNGADGYQVYVNFGGTNSLTYNITGKTTMTGQNNSNYTGSYYTGKVRAYKTINGKKVYGGYSEELLLCGKVTNVEVNMNGKNATVKWATKSGATGYGIEQWVPGIGNVDKRDIGNVKNTTLQDAEGNSVRVRAYKTINGKKVYGPYSGYAYMVKVSNVKVTRTGSTIKVTWNKVENAAGYEVIYNSQGILAPQPLTTTNSKTISGVRVGDQVTVRAYGIIEGNEKSYGEFSYAVTIK